MNRPPAVDASAYGAQDMVAPLKRVLMRRPSPEMAAADPELWHYAGPLDAATVAGQYDSFVRLVEAAGAEILWVGNGGDGLADSIFTRDPSLVTSEGAVLLNLGKKLRRPEADLHGRAYESLGVPILGRVDPPGTVEGGDCMWLDAATLAVGRGFRTNQAGIDRLAAVLAPLGVAIHVFDLPVWEGEQACLHLMSLVSLLDRDLALIYRPLLPAPLYQFLVARGIALVECPDHEFLASGGLCLNVLAVAPRHGIMIDGFAETRRGLERAGCRIDTFPGDGLCIPCEGGPTCLTRPVLRG